jgi:hypothetical protein
MLTVTAAPLPTWIAIVPAPRLELALADPDEIRLCAWASSIFDRL